MILTPIITNRQSGTDLPEWIQLAPKGEFPITLGNKHYIQVIDAEAVALLANSLAQCGPSGALLDYDHFSHDSNHPSEAAGWIKELQARGDGLWGRVEFTDKGADAVRNRRYIFVSPTWNFGDCQAINAKNIRPTRLRNAALTNAPNLIGIRPIVNRLPADAAQGPAGTDPAKPQQGVPMDYKVKLIAMLGLAADATDEQIATALAAKTAAPPPEKAAANSESGATLDAVTAERDALKARIAELEAKLLEEQVEKDLDENKDVIANRAAAKAVLLANRENGLAMLKALRNPDAGQALHNRADARTPSANAVEGDSAASLAEKQRTAVLIIKNREKCTNTAAWNIARQEKPELFRPAE
jgi:hypothetical protein